jgi:hypothetical protein
LSVDVPDTPNCPTGTFWPVAGDIIFTPAGESCDLTCAYTKLLLPVWKNKILDVTRMTKNIIKG